MKKQSGKLGRRVLSALAASAMVSSQVLSAMPFGAIAADGEVFLGDVNEDGTINAADAVMIENYATGKTSSIKLEAADVNADGKVTLADAELVYQYYAYSSTGGALPINEFLLGMDDFKWQHYPDPSNYEIIDEGMSWQEAENYCESQGGHLVVISSNEEQAQVEALLKEKESVKNTYWIGMRRNSSNDFGWVTGEESDFANWTVGTPNNSDGSQNAALIYATAYPKYDRETGQWDDLNESGEWENDSFFGLENFGFIMEKDGLTPAEYNLWKDETSLPTSGFYKLDCDVTADSLDVAGYLDIDLNGHTVNIPKRSL